MLKDVSHGFEDFLPGQANFFEGGRDDLGFKKPVLLDSFSDDLAVSFIQEGFLVIQLCCFDKLMETVGAF